MTEWIAEGRRAGGVAAGVQCVAAGVQKVQEVQEVQEVLAAVQCIALYGMGPKKVLARLRPSRVGQQRLADAGC
jgi:hypothetical protein